MDSIQRALQNIGRMWSALHATQRVILSASAVLMIVLLVWGSAASAPTWVRVAGPEVAADARANILRKLQEKNQKHEVRGAEIYVPKEDADRVVLELAGDGAMNDDAIWKFLETSDIFMSPKDKEMRYKHALEQKLGMMIRRVEFVRNASVLITPGSKADRLGFEGQRASASVQVELQEGRVLTAKNTVAIANLVAKSVPGLDTDQVVITDTKGNSYALPKQEGGTALAQFFREYEKSIEEDIQGRIKQAFRTAIVMVRVEARKTSISKDTVKNTNPRIEQEEEHKRVEKGAGGTAATVVKGDNPSPAPAEPGTRETTDQDLKTKSRFDTERTQVTDPAGQVERINIGVLIPIETGPDKKELIDAEKQLDKITQWVRQAAAGKATSESVSVQFIASARPEAIVAPPAPETLVEWASKHATKVGLFGLSLAALFVLLRVVQTAMARDTVEEIQSLTDALNEGREAATEMAGGASPAAGDLGRLKQSVQDMVGRNPQSVAASLKSFMSGK
jgi:flagellar biosynthesis/type III secretory pathway M-ring protein FliF/YscJ